MLTCFEMEADSNMCTCDEGGEGADLLSSLAIAFIVVVGLLVIGGVLLIGLARRFWKRKVAEAVEESRGSESFLESRDFELAREERRRDLPPPYSPIKPPSPLIMLPPAYEESHTTTTTISNTQPSYQELIESLHQQLLLQGPGAVHLLHLLQTDPDKIARQLAQEGGD